MCRLIQLLLLTGLLVLTHTLALAERTNKAQQTLVFGVVPQKSVAETAKDWAPIVDYLAAKTGLRLVFSTAKDITTFESRLSDSEYDIVYLNPYSYVVHSAGQRYRAFANAKDEKLAGILVVRKGSPIKTLSDLNGQTLVFPSPAAFAATMLPFTHLTHQGIRFTPKYVSSHDSVYLAVANELYPAGGGIPRTLNAMEPQIKDQLRILWTSPAYTPHAFAAHKRVPKEIVAKILTAMMGMLADKHGAELLKQISARNGIIVADDSDYDDMRAARILTP